jgi:phasin
MTNTYEVPAEMREFAERSVAQARKAFEGFMGAVHKTADQVGTNPAIEGAKDVSSKAVTFAEANVLSAFELSEKLVHAKDPQDVFAIQSEYLKAQAAALEGQFKELGEAVQKAFGVKK